MQRSCHAPNFSLSTVMQLRYHICFIVFVAARHDGKNENSTNGLTPSESILSYTSSIYCQL